MPTSPRARPVFLVRGHKDGNVTELTPSPFKELHERPAHAITAKDVRVIIKGIEHNAANRAHALNALYGWAMEVEDFEENPS